MVALLIAVQFALSVIPGVELVTVLLLVFSYTAGARWGMLTATAFSLLRCILFGFSPTAVTLYLIYYNVFAGTFGVLGKRGVRSFWVCPVVLAVLLLFCAYFAATGIPTSVLYQRRIQVMLWGLFALLCAVFVGYFFLLFYGKKRGEEWKEVASVVAFATLFTVCFTLLDDVITPLFFRYTADAALAYFYASFFAMIPQAVCTVVSVATLFLPLRKIFKIA